MNHPTPPRTILEVWNQGTSERGNKVWSHADSYEGGPPADVKRTANEHYRDARNDFVFPAYIVRDAETLEPIWCTHPDASWQPRWQSVRQAITDASAHTRFFFRPPLPGIGAALIARQSVEPALLVGVSGTHLETLHVLVNGKIVTVDGRNHFWARFGFVKGPVLPEALRVANYEGDRVWLDMVRAGSFTALFDQVTSAISAGDYLLRKANNFIAPGRLSHLQVERYDPRPPPRFKLKPAPANSRSPKKTNRSKKAPKPARSAQPPAASPAQPLALDLSSSDETS